jgi:hypothetical protein
MTVALIRPTFTPRRYVIGAVVKPAFLNGEML